TPAASSVRIPPPPPIEVAKKEPEAPVKNDLGITEAWADDPELPPPKANRVSEPIKRVSQSIPILIEPPTGPLKLEQSIAPEPNPAPKPDPKSEPQIGVTQVFERPAKPPPPPMPAVARTPTPPPVSLIEE